MIDFDTIVSNWYFEAKTPEGKDFSPVGLYKTVKQELVDLQEVIRSFKGILRNEIF